MKKAFTWLEENGIAYTFHDYKIKSITENKIREWLKHTDLPSLINTKGSTYRNLDDADKKAISNTTKAIKLMITYPSMIKRPVVETGHEVMVGFNPEFWDKHL